MEVSSTQHEGGRGDQTLRPPSRLSAYVSVGTLLGLGVAVVALSSTPWGSFTAEALIAPATFLAIAVIVGELRPITMESQRGGDRTLSMSTPFVLALIATSGIGIAIAIQGIASLADDVRRGSSLSKALFNTAQYSLSVFVGGATYALFADESLWAIRGGIAPRDLLAVLVAGAAMIAINWLLVGGVVSLATRSPFLMVLTSNLREFLVTNIVLLSVGGIAALVARDGIVALLLLAAPVIAAHIFAAEAARHAYDAAHDPLTGLANRGQLNFELDKALEETEWTHADGPGLILLDLDHFKDINDALGHPVGDQILVQVAARLSTSAPVGSQVHRLGGDEFAVLVPGGLSDTRQAAYDLLAAFDGPVPVEQLELLVRASVGIAIAPGHGTDASTLMKNADIALYHAKVERDRISTYSEEFDVNSVEQLQLLAELRSAISEGQLRVVYQPQVDLASSMTVAVEALVRWDHPERGPVSAADFIPLAENSGLIFALTEYVLDTALAQLAKWRDKGYDLRMSVNLSARHLSDLGLPDQVWEASAVHHVPLNKLVLEVTETGILSDPARADVVIRSLRDLGVEVSIDDYGTGNASLSYLKRLEIDELKIDRSFVSNILTDDHDRIIVHSTVALALDLGLRVIAEGIEDEETTRRLLEHQGVIGQGYHLGRPVPAYEITDRLEREREAERKPKRVKGRG